MIKKIFIVLLMVFVLFSLTHIVIAGHYTINTHVIKAVIEEDEIIKSPLSILGTEGERFSVNYFSADDFISVSSEEFVLDSLGAGMFNVVLDGEGLEEGVYVGEVIVEEETHSLEIPVILEKETFSRLFDVAIEVPGSSSTIPGGFFEVDVSVFRFKGLGNRVILDYKIINLEGDVILSETQSLDVAQQIKITKSFEIPDDALGDYVLSISARDVGYISTGTSTELFSVAPLSSPEEMQEDFSNTYLYISFFIILVLITSFLVFNYYWNRKNIVEAKDWSKKLAVIKRTKFSNVAKEISKLEYQKNILEKAYAKGYIKKASYEEGRKKVNSLIIRLKKRL